jgi:hypothetical protein
MRLIDADKLKNSYGWWEGNDRQLTRDEVRHYFDAMIDAQATVEAELIMYDTGSWQTTVTNMPPVEYAPIKHGHWINTGSGEECSVCGEIQYGYDSYRNYCTNCGAKMDEVVERKNFIDLGNGFSITANGMDGGENESC